MSKSIASRFFSAISMVVIISVGVLGVTFMMFASKYFEGERINTLTLCVESALNNLDANYETNFHNITDMEKYRENLKLISTTAQATVMVTDSMGNIIVGTDNTVYEYMGGKVSQDLLDMFKDDFRAVSVSKYFTDLFKDTYYAVGLPIALDGKVTGYIFAISTGGTLNIFTNALLSTFLLSASVMILISSVVSLVVTSKFTTPIRNITEAAKKFSQGDFSARAHVEGDDEVAKLAYTFNKMATFAENNDKSYSHFVANISHELRTPMTSIKGFVDGIIDGTIPPEKEQTYLKIVSEEIGRLARLTNSMLNISKLDSGEFVMNVNKYNIWDTISAVAFAFESRIESQQIEVRGFEPQRIMVLADKDIIHQVVYNIVDNAIKFTNKGGYIEFNVSEDKNGEFVTVKIKNSGEGISKEAIPYVFERFYKEDFSRSVHTKGAGIGLYIAKTLVQRSGGDIYVESVEKEYTEFVFSLPAATDKNKKALAEKSKKNHNEKGKKQAL